MDIGKIEQLTQHHAYMGAELAKAHAENKRTVKNSCAHERPLETCELFDALQKAESENKRLRDALKSIESHMELVGGGLHKHGAIYHIVQAALRGEGGEG
jgi:tRNA/tmRNA/rRNA uracil-C5-methylase (TrmA/RlmC/RlmD family)